MSKKSNNQCFQSIKSTNPFFKFISSSIDKANDNFEFIVLDKNLSTYDISFTCHKSAILDQYKQMIAYLIGETCKNDL